MKCKKVFQLDLLEILSFGGSLGIMFAGIKYLGSLNLEVIGFWAWTFHATLSLIVIKFGMQMCFSSLEFLLSKTKSQKKK